LVKACLTTVSFAVIVNGRPGRSFKPSRGLRQGDLLSPYLFLLVSEALSMNLTKAVNNGEISGIRIARRCPTLSHLFFADDSLFFVKADVLNCRNIKGVLDSYCLASGQFINYHKSCFYFSLNTPEEIRRSLCSLLSIDGVNNPGLYLGLPTIWGR
ncbi:unnamed protein product, partial [Prunus brigantina]